MPRTILSPIALTSRDQVLAAISTSEFERVEGVCHELLDVNTRGMSLDSPGARDCVAAVMEGVLAALNSTRTSVLESAMHAVAGYAAHRDGADPTSVARTIRGAASVIEVAETNFDLKALKVAIKAALATCDRLLGPDRSSVVAFLEDTLSGSALEDDCGMFRSVGSP